ncbi:chemokine-like protein TAFA-5 isoform X1 [Chrysemys picta bellii]|uniref:chemokine-like protein TAFA-5 isoform X1 n=1 Tax=Chrysemys picta bellii TaxID=8478 RepID=UPI0032B144DD
MLAGWRELSAGIGATLCCLLFFWLLYSHPPKEGKELEVGTCEIMALNRDLSHPRRMIARQTARCACKRGQVAGTTRTKPACVDAQLIASKQWCGMEPCDEGEQCTLLINRSGWSCTRRLGRIKTITVKLICCSRLNLQETFVCNTTMQRGPAGSPGSGEAPT